MTAITIPAHQLQPGDVLLRSETELFLPSPTLTDVDRRTDGSVVLFWPERGVETAHKYFQHLIFVAVRRPT